MEKMTFRKSMFQSRIHRSEQSSSIILAALATRASNPHMVRSTHFKSYIQDA